MRFMACHCQSCRGAVLREDQCITPSLTDTDLHLSNEGQTYVYKSPNFVQILTLLSKQGNGAGVLNSGTTTQIALNGFITDHQNTLLLQGCQEQIYWERGAPVKIHRCRHLEAAHKGLIDRWKIVGLFHTNMAAPPS